MNIIIRLAFLGMMMLASACGGGGSGSPSSIDNQPPTNTSSSSSVTIDKSALQVNEATTVRAKFADANGNPAAGVTVTFTTSSGTLDPLNGQVVADSTGTATIQLTAAASGTVTATATVGGSQVSKYASFAVIPPVLKLSAITLGLSSIPYGGSTSVSVSVLNENGTPYTGQAVDVSFTSTQAAAGKATLPAKVTSVNGVATATYQANTVVGSDTITVTLGSTVVQTTIAITPLSAGSITYVSATPTNLALKGTGGIGKSEVSTVIFKVLDSSGSVRPNTTVDFALNTTVGGISLSSTSGSTGTDGTVAVQVNSGIIATTVRVTATIRGTAISTQSEQLVVSTGLPAQDGFSLSVETLNVEAWSIDGVSDKVTVRLSDHFHNPVPDGTAVYFTTSGGSIQPSCTTVGGSCSVTWTSQNPRPLQATGAKLDGRAVILAYAIGEEAFVDANGNGVADAGEFTDDPEAYRDDNENGVRNAGEPFIDFNGDGTFNTGDGKYNGVLQGTAYAGAPKSKHVFSNVVLVMGTSAADIQSSPSPFTVPLNSYASVQITVRDLNGNNMPAGTTVDFKLTTTVQGATVNGGSSTATSLTMPTYDKYTFPNTAAMGGVTFTLTVSDPSKTTSAKGVLEVTVTSPKGLVTKGYVAVN